MTAGTPQELREALKQIIISEDMYGRGYALDDGEIDQILHLFEQFAVGAAPEKREVVAANITMAELQKRISYNSAIDQYQQNIRQIVRGETS